LSSFERVCSIVDETIAVEYKMLYRFAWLRPPDTN